MRVLVYGGRDYGEVPFNVSPADVAYHRRRAVREASLLDATLMELYLDGKLSVVIHGGYRGADRHAGRWAVRNGVPSEVFKADWKKHKRAAGPIRNQRMLVEGKPDLGVEFPGGDGTADMRARLDGAGVPVREVR